MTKIYSDGKVFLEYSEIVPMVLEAMIDARFKYLREKEYENHKTANRIIKEEYEPAVKILKNILETKT